jgi:branched-chain amino acid transport system ATP-binding protein
VTAGAPALDVDGLSASYGHLRALFDVSFSVDPGAAVALVGANGAGKSTVARVVTGLVPAGAGRVRIGGTDVTGRHAWEIARRGVTHVTEGRSVFSSLTVEENLVLTFRATLGRAGVGAALERSFAAFPRLGERRGQSAGTLSGGEQRMLALARALGSPPKLLVVDELSFGLAPVVVEQVYAALDRVRDEGCALLLVEQHVDRALRLADRVVVLRKGRVVADGPPAELAPKLDELVLGPGPG